MDLANRLECIRSTASDIEEIVRTAGTAGVRYNDELILRLHRLMTAGDPEVHCNAYRTEPVEVKHTLPGDEIHIVQCPPPEQVPTRMAKLFDFLNSSPAHLQARHGFKHFVQTHPFLEGNGRCGRALLALILRASAYLAGGDAIVGFLYDYFEVHGKKQRFGTLIRDIVINKDNGPWNQYFAELLPYLKQNDGRMVIPPDDPGGTTQN